MATPRPSRQSTGSEDDDRRNSLIRRSWYAMTEVLFPFSPSALASLPKKTFQPRPRYTRADNVPDAPQDEDGQMPTVRDYHAINHLPPQVRIPKKIATPIKVEGKVWFANERSTSGPRSGASAVFVKVLFRIIAAWISYLQTAVLIGTLALALFNASKDQIARNFAYAYAILSIAVTVRTCPWTTRMRFIKSLISWLVQVYGYAVYQHRITMIRRRDPGNFGASGRSTGTLKPYVLHFTTLTDQITGPVLISAFLFFAVLANFIIRGEFDQIVDYMRHFGDTY